MERNKKLKLVFTVLFLILTCLSTNLFAQNYWSKVAGPQGGSVKIITSSPGGDLFLVTNYGYVYSSTDDGLSWTRLSNEPPSPTDMVIDSEGRIYVAVWAQGIYRSDDNGDSWVLKTNGLTNTSIYTISYDSDTGHLYAGTDYGGIFRSMDGGESWSAVNTGLTNYENLRIQSINVSPNGELYAAGWDWGQMGGVYVSTNFGDTWKQINGDLPNTNIRSVVADAENRIFCATYGAGLFRTIDGGITWENLISGITTNYFRILKISTDETMFAGSIDGGLFISYDHGDNWERTAQVLINDVLSMTIKQANNAVFVGLTGAGVFKSGDMGASWTEVNNGLLYSPIEDLIVTPEGPIFTSIFQSGIARSMDGGATWKRVNNGLSDATIFNFAAKTGIIFAGSQRQGVLRSTDGGNSWQTASSDIPSTYIYTVFLDHYGSVYAGTSLNNLYRSINDGDNWTEVYTAAANQSVQTMVSDESADVIFAGLSSGGGVIRSKNGGVDWVPINNGLGNLFIHSLAISPDHNILAGTDLGLYRSLDYGDSWNRIAADNLPNIIKRVVVNPLGHIFLASDVNLGVFVSKDGGQSWKTENSGLENLVVQAFDFDQQNHLWVGILDGGVYKSVRSTTEVQVHFAVKLKNQDGFDPSSASVAVAGDFNGWATNDPILTSQHDEEMTYTGSVSINNASELVQDGLFHYKYIIPPETWELFNYNRSVEWDGRSDLVLDTVWFSNQKEFSKMNVTPISVDGTDSRGIAWADYDNDGNEDVVIAEAGPSSRNDLFHNNGNGTFTQITTGSIANDNGDSQTACWGDFNNDGYVDLYITNLGDENNFLYKNNGDGSFTRILSDETVNTGGNSVGAVWADFDQDGFLDLFVANSGTESNFLFMNNQDESFTKVTGQSIVNDIGDSRGCTAADFDNDGDIDVFVANAGADEGNILYLNDGSGNFTGLNTGAVASARNASVGGSWGDYDNDGWLDLYVINSAGSSNTLFKNDQEGGFVAVEPTALPADSADSRGSAWLDYDNDGLLDLYVTNAGERKNILYKQLEGGIFSIVPEGPLVEDPQTDSRGTAWGDFNKDGYPDLIVANNAGPNALYRNNLTGNHSVNIKLIGTVSNRSAIGASLRLYYVDDGGHPVFQRRDVMSQTGHLSQNSMIASFGLGQSTLVDSVIIRWPNGIEQTIRKDIRFDQLLTITEPNPSVPPPAPTLVSPQKGATDVSIPPTLNWNPAGDAGQYHLIFADNASFNQLIVDDTLIEGTSYTMTDLKYNQIYYWQVRAKNDAGWGPWSELWNFTTEQFTGTPNKPVQIVPGNGVANVPIPAPLVWRSDVPGTYAVQVSTDNTFSDLVFNNGAITDSSVFVNGLDYSKTYYWRVNVTITGITSAWSDTLSFTTLADKIPVSVPIAFPQHDRRDEFSSSDYLMLGLPGGSDIPFSTVLGDGDGQTWMAYWDNGKSGTPADYFIPYDGSNIFRFSTGRAFWIIHNGSININQSIPAAVLNEFAQAEVTIHSGWNMITSPFGHHISWEAVKKANNITATIPLWRYDRSNKRFVSYTYLEPVEGFYFYNPSSAKTILLVPYIDAFSKPLVRQDMVWDMEIELTSGETKATSASLGIATGASTELDQFDYRKPHTFANLADIYFERPEWDKTNNRFGSDIRPAIDGSEAWDFKVYIPQKVESRLTFPGLSTIPEDYDVYLIDKTRLTFQNLREDNVYDFISTTELSNFEIIIGETQAVEDKLQSIIPLTYSLGRNYPNPFNPATTIPLTLPEQSDVTLNVFNILGQEVVTLFKGSLNPGRHYFVWNGTNQAGAHMPSGIYIYQLTTNSGLKFANKMVMIK